MYIVPLTGLASKNSEADVALAMFTPVLTPTLQNNLCSHLSQ